jgi:hypothetical protein
VTTPRWLHCVEDGPNLAVVASNAGEDRHPEDVMG